MTEFSAKVVETFKNEFSDDFVVFNLFFEESDPKDGGESWNFQRALGADGTVESLGEYDDGVCTVKEIQLITLYEGIATIELHRNKFICIFEPDSVKEVKTDHLIINFELNNEQWEKLLEMTQYVFKNKDYFKTG